MSHNLTRVDKVEPQSLRQPERHQTTAADSRANPTETNA
jgi:hypothetical protein